MAIHFVFLARCCCSSRWCTSSSRVRGPSRAFWIISRSLCSYANCSTANCSLLANQSTSSYDVLACNSATNSWADGWISGKAKTSSKGTVGVRSSMVVVLLAVALSVLAGSTVTAGWVCVIDDSTWFFFIGRLSLFSAWRFFVGSGSCVDHPSSSSVG